MAARWGADGMRRNLPDAIALLGIDEATAAYGDGGGSWRVVGPGQVTVYASHAGDAGPVAYDNGQTFNLAE